MLPIRLLVCCVALVLCAPSVLAQPVVLPYNTASYNRLSEQIASSPTNLHTGMKPLWRSQAGLASADSVLYRHSRDRLLPASWQRTWFWRKLRNEDFAIFEGENYRVHINPLLRLEKGRDAADGRALLINTRGITLEGSVGKRLSFSSTFYENQATYPQYINDLAFSYGIIPGQGSPKLFGTDGHDFSRTEAQLSLQALSWLRLQVGHGRHFIGEGYRSMILSDNTYPYPFMRVALGKGAWQLQLLYTQFTDFMDRTKEGRVWHYNYHYRRHSSMSYLSYKPSPKLELALFEGIMWLTTDTAAKTYNRIPASFFSPIPLIRTFNYGLDDQNNVLLGLNAKYAPWRNLMLYGQAVLDALPATIAGRSAAKWATQAGAKFTDNHLIPIVLQAEYNMAAPYTYAHENARSNWTNYNQALAHPLGANFAELVLYAELHLGDWELRGRYIGARFGADANGSNVGSNIFLPQTTATLPTDGSSGIGQGQPGSLSYLWASVALNLNPRTNLQLFVDVAKRNYTVGGTAQKMDYIGVGIRSQLYNYYFDF